MNRLKQELIKSKNQWEWNVATLISKIPRGKIISYGQLAQWANKDYGTNITALNVAMLRKKIYGMLRPADIDLPLHRISSKGDVFAQNDSVETREDIKIKRWEETRFINA